MNQQLDDSIVQFNRKRICLSAKIMLAISVVLGIANIAASVLSVRDVPYFKGYLVVYGLMIFLNIAALYYFHDRRQTTYAKTMMNVYIYGIILCGVCISYIDLEQHQHYFIFGIIYFFCSTLFIMQLRTFIVVSMLSFSVITMRLNEVTAGESLINEKSIFILNMLLIGLAVQHFVSRTQRLVIEQDIELKESVAESNRLMAALVQANEALTKQAMNDNLTMIPNRNGFYTYATQYIQQHGGEPLTLLMMDIDFFKQYNDLYNHVQGDRILHKIAQIIHGVVAQYDGYVARWGGEEFLVMTTPTHAEAICQDIQQALAKAAIVHERSPIHHYVTVSIGGFSGTITSVEEIDDFYKRADLMLYEVKQHGRNHFRIEQGITANT